MPRVLTSRHLRVFAAVMKSRSLAEAALKLGVSEAAVSKLLRLLEQETGVALFDRSAGRLRPTAAARQWLPHAQRAAQQLDFALGMAYELGRGKRSRVTIAAHAPPLIAIVPQAIKRLRQDFPDVEVDLRVETPHDTLELVAHQEVDLGVTNQPLPQSASNLDLCERRTVSEDLLVAALPPGHRLAGRSVVRPDDLHGETLIALPDDSPTTILVEATLNEAGVPVRAPVLARNSLAACALVREAVGIALINPLLLAKGIFPDIVLRPFRPRIVLWTEVYYSAVRPLAPEAAALVRQIESAAADLKHRTSVDGRVRVHPRLPANG
ncbi:MAG: LysR family transcriptional regulator [Pigmentiphaga sp.]|uniref:LysR family transcriptional regulator n=1 Tax=Pigmentiphaga sp. TaxID=1977564 RepID=UPI0029BE3445|nr:LysR family transcriptional regulator [Pigmentiphaga sp.]MDX3905342.1 LysR family transcriptional regulator [Pigmentiphaga sp.]